MRAKALLPPPKWVRVTRRLLRLWRWAFLAYALLGVVGSIVTHNLPGFLISVVFLVLASLRFAAPFEE